MKKLGIVFAVLLVVLMAVLVIGTLGFRSKQIPAAPVGVMEISAASIDHLAEAVKFKTISYEEEQTSLFDSAPFRAFQGFLEKTFPLVHSNLKKDVIGEFSLLYRWEGRRTDLKPILLMAHMDVVPVAAEVLSSWAHPPFDGVIADGFIWGRGTLDDKQYLMGILEAVELLLRDGARPERSLYLAFGHDEEILGTDGAVQIAQKLREEGREFEFILDEGLVIAEGVIPGITKPIALVGIAEKGYASLELRARAEGGHSSMPPSQTAVGILSRALANLESHQRPAAIQGPTGEMFRFVGPEMTYFRKLVFANLWLFGKLVVNQLTGTPSTNAVVRTTTAATVFSGGIKDNVLPTEARAVVNFRIIPGETVATVLEHAKNVVADDRVMIAVRENATEPSPVSDVNSPAFRTIQKTIAEVFPDALAAPGLMVGATDARHYTSLSGNIFRFNPVRLTSEDLKRPHGINERISVENYRNAIRFFHRLIMNAAK